MAPLAVGIDLVEVERIRRLATNHPAGMNDRIFTPAEWAACAGQPHRLAGRFAAKEAMAKALGTGLIEVGGATGVSALEIETRSEPSGRPTIHLMGTAQARANAMGISGFEVSLSHTLEYAVAIVVGIPDR